MSTGRVTITTAAGVEVTGYVHGSGGILRESALDVLERCIRRANRGQVLHIHEPKPWHCAVYEHARAAGDGPVTLVDLRGASVELAPEQREALARRAS